ncbi:hypothetical protein AGMMS49579_06470 [Spirochaetia bacterium]|nr:hypothetical protein AGMMS49579_06470 [Spirochaetia bacterium]
MKRILRSIKRIGIRERTARPIQYIINRLVLLEAQQKIQYPALEKLLESMEQAKNKP